jgi:uncharacterized protein
MQVKLEQAFPLPASADAAWRLLQNIPEVAACMPGAEIIERLGETRYKGRLTVKLGPATLAFNGDIEVQGIDATQRRVHLVGRGADVKGTSAASMDLTASLRETGTRGCELVGVSEVSMSGKLASFGGRMMTQVAEQIMKQFAANFAGKLAADPGAARRAEQPGRLNALALAWAALVGFLKGLFGGKSKAAG